MNEQRKYQVIKDLVDQHKNKRRAALTLDITVRQVNRLIRKYQDKGKAAFAIAVMSVTFGVNFT
nr:helix-turn-helix domain-containing protein [Lactobacillus acetotolerans]